MNQMTSLRIFTAISLISICSVAAFGQETSNIESPKKFGVRYGQPDIPGSFVMDIGFTAMLHKPSLMATSFWGSKMANLYYYYDFQLGKSGFAFSPGLGFGFDKYDFTESVTLINPTGDSVSIQDLITSRPTVDINKSKLSTNYLDIPIELRWHSNPNNFRRSFYIAAGGKIGLLISNTTKLKYKEDGVKVIEKEKRDLDLNKLRYGIIGRLGYRGFSLFYYHNLSTLFQKNKGPQQTAPVGISFGLTIRGF